MNSPESIETTIIHDNNKCPMLCPHGPPSSRLLQSWPRGELLFSTHSTFNITVVSVSLISWGMEISGTVIVPQD